MRKISNYRDWCDFVADLLAHTNGKYELFGISRDGKDWGGQAEFTREYDHDGFCQSYNFSWSDVVSDREHMSRSAFYADIIEFVEQKEFYIVDTGANYNWL